MSPPSKTTCKDGADPIQVPSVVILEDEDAESGNGPSLPMSPRSVEAIPAATTSSEARGGVTPVKQDIGVGGYRQADIDFSLCGGLDDASQFSRTLFESGKLSFDDFAERLKIKDLNLFSNPNLVVRIGDQYFNWESACPIIMSRVLYGRSLPSELVDVIAAAVTAVPQAVPAAVVESAQPSTTQTAPESTEETKAAEVDQATAAAAEPESNKR